MNATYPSHDSDSASRWMWAITGALVWHALVLGLGSLVDPFGAKDPRIRGREPIDLVFETAETKLAAPQSDAGPRVFTELPPDRADLRPDLEPEPVPREPLVEAPAPDQPTFSSNVDSRARDRATEGEYTSLPRMDGEGDNPQVEILPTRVPWGDATSVEQEQPGELGPPSEFRMPSDSAQLGEGPEADSQGDENDTQARSPLRGRQGDPQADILRRVPETRLEEPRHLIGIYREDLYQQEMDNRLGNVPLFGDVSLNTIAWEWAPWLQHFIREWYRNWLVPYAYRIGVIEGHQVIRVEIAKDGQLLGAEVLEEQGHSSLTESSLATFRAITPLVPLPDDFPEETLILTFDITYELIR